MRVRLLALILVVLAVPAAAQKAAVVKGPLASAKGLRCSFPIFAAVRWADQTPNIVTGNQDFSFAIDSFDYKKGRARIVGVSGTAWPASMLLTQTGMNVIEQTPIGNLNLTTIFAAGGQGNTFLAVHARHIGDLATVPTSSQAYGTCQLQP